MNEEIKRISYSQFKNWKECPYRHKLIYLDKLPHFEGNEYTAFGTAIHAVCEETVPGSPKFPIQVFQESFDSELQQLVDNGARLNMSLVEDMKSQAVNICNQIFPEVKRYFGKFEVVSVEEQLLEPIDEFESYGTNFKGFIDMVIKTENGRYHIIDWKTCTWGWNSKKKSDPLTTYQLTYYKNYFSKKHNIDAANIDTYFVLLKRTAKKDNVEVLKVTSGFKKITNALKILENAVINIEKGIHIKNRLNCKYCKFHKTEYCK